MIRIQNAFSKWMIVWKGRNNLPTDHAWYLENVRIKNWWIMNKKWAKRLVDAWWYIQAIFWYDLTNSLYYIRNSVLYKYPSNAYSSLFITAWDRLTWTNPRTVIQYWDFVLLLNWKSHMRVFHENHWIYRVDNASWYQSWSSILPLWISDWVWVRMPDPIIWWKITWFTFIAGNNSVTKNILYISHPITTAEPFKCYDFSIPGGWQEYDVWENRYMDSEIQWMVSTGENLYVFCKNSIEVLWRSTVSVVWWIATLSTLKIWNSAELATPRLVVAVGDQVFYYTKTKKICTINYTPGIDDPEIDLHFSDEINDRLFLNIDFFQRTAYAYHDKKESLVEFHLNSVFSDWDTPDVVIIRDLKNRTRLMDRDIGFQMLCSGWDDWDQTYWTHWNFIYEDNVDLSQHNRYQTTEWVQEWIEAKYHTTNIALWNENQEKLFQWFSIAWWMTISNQIVVRCFIDWRLEFTKNILWSEIANTELSAIDTWDPRNYNSIDRLFPFEYVADQGMLRKKGKRIRISVECSEPEQQFYVDTLFIDAVPTWNFELNDKF